MESETNHNCNFCENANALKKCGKSHTRCKQIRFCNKNCDTAAHSKERESKVTANENPSDNSGNSTEKAIQAEFKRVAKKAKIAHRNLNLAMHGSERIILRPDQFKALRRIASSGNTPRPRDGQTPEDNSRSKLSLSC